MSTRVQDSDASRPRRPASSARTDSPSLQSHDDVLTRAAEPGDSSAMEHLLRTAIVVKPHPPKLTIQPRSLQPLMLLPCQHLRLSFLDLSSPYGSFEPSASFEANIRLLDLESRMGNRPVVLIARLERNGSIYAIERQPNALYSLCHLGSWVDLDQLCALAIVSCLALIRKKTTLPPEAIAHAPLTTPQISHTNKKRRLAIEAIQSLVKRPTRSPSISALSQAAKDSRPPTPIQGQGDALLDTGSVVVRQDGPSSGAPGLGPHVESHVSLAQNQDEAPTMPNAESIFDNIRNHYFEALYHSMGSLAYFAKGPLSRARAAFHLDCDSVLEMSDLVEFLKSLIMTTVQIDKKYRETIPKIQSEMKTTLEDSDVEPGQGKAKPKRRRIKKVKLGKDGLYPDENEHVRKWWTSCKPLLKDDEEAATKSTEQRDIKLQVSLLRSRETQLQMIVILEILSLEPLIVHETANHSQLPGLPVPKESLGSPKQIPAKKRNKHNLPVLLDVHADRLCIWQSTALDELSGMNESQIGARPESQRSSKFTSDPLRDFCVDIIVPFFSAKLPEHCDSINRKLGGPVMMLPPKPNRKLGGPVMISPKSNQKMTGPLSKAQFRVGVAAKRPVPPKASGTLENFLSKETERNRRSMSRGPGGVIALMRSASTPTIPLLKREASEPLSLTSIPKADSNISREKHLSATDPIFSRRRAETREKRDAFVKAELRDAISTLRRPNREIVGKVMAEADERRAAKSLSQLRKSRKPTEHSRFQSVVKATPVGSRFHDVFAKDHDSQSALLQRLGTTREEQVPPSSSMVPSSAPRKRNREAAFGNEPATQPKLVGLTTTQIIATPAKQSAPSRNFLSAPQPDEGVVLASSPVMSRKISQPSFVAKTRPASFGHQDSGITMPSSPAGPNILEETPIKPRQRNVATSMDHYVTVTPVKKGTPHNRGAITASVGRMEVNEAARSSEENPRRKMTVFERLGWDDDYDELA
ncbi:DNA replication regulator SLD3-domain-containing protein [Nemania serpens]|nr:DNA replication regulator SLD3-domain-containing protein [Nemania serpens]